MTTRRIRAGRLQLALHQLQDVAGPPVLLLHQLRASGRAWADDLSGWPGPVFGLDFSGHGESDWLAGGGYFPELFAADADQALSEIGPCHLVGAGVGAYAALLLAGARPTDVAGALLRPGVGLDGHGPTPDYDDIPRRSDVELASFEGSRERQTGTDPMVRMAETDIRPTDYVSAFGERARRLVLAGDGTAGPAWWQALLSLPNVTAIEDSPQWPATAARHLLAGALSTEPTRG